MMSEVLGQYSLIRTPWNCQFYSPRSEYPGLGAIRHNCSEHNLETPKCPEELALCCFFCKKQTTCCDKCEFLTVDEGDFER